MPEKRRVVQILLNRTLASDPNQSVDDLIVAAHTNVGQPQIRKANRDSVYYPLPECMCLRKGSSSSSDSGGGSSSSSDSSTSSNSSSS